MQESLLVELLTEELPPKSLRQLARSFGEGIFNGLKEQSLLAEDSHYREFATPRRLAVQVTNVLDRQPDRVIERKGPGVSVALDTAGNPSRALTGFADSYGVEVAALEKRTGDKGEYFICRIQQVGEALEKHLPAIVQVVLRRLPVAKLMQWGSSTEQFVRPVHGLIMLHGGDIVPGEALGLQSGNQTLGHRFLSDGKLMLRHADDYEKTLEEQGKVIADFDKRLQMIRDSFAELSGEEYVVQNAALLEEVTALVEYPQIYKGAFNPDFLSVPQECLMISMQRHQKYFPLVDECENLLPRFLIVSNLQTDNPAHIIHGNERVLRARLSDAAFFYNQDRKTRLQERVPKLANVVYHNKLGSQLQRVGRISSVAQDIARRLKGDSRLVGRAAYLCKADLVSEMVGEFPELQGIMGKYYALNDGEDERVARAIEQHYYPRHADDSLPGDDISASLALADKLDTLAGIYGIGLLPTGDKDPFGLRRNALGVLRILAERPLPLDLMRLLETAKAQFPVGLLSENTVPGLYDFMLGRLKSYLREKGYAADEIETVVSMNPIRIDLVLPRLDAVREFRKLSEAESLATANKRIRNILKKADGTRPNSIDNDLLEEDSEKTLAEQVRSLEQQVIPLLERANYTQALKHLATLRPAVDDFFDTVMVMSEDPKLRDNRLALLCKLQNLFLGVADLSKLQS